MAFFKMGVAVDIKNHQFRHGTAVYAEIDSTYSAATPTTTLSIKNTTSYINYILGAGDKVVIGPSTHTDNYGAKQELTVSSLSLVSMVFTENVIYSFNSNDPITGFGTYFPSSFVFKQITNSTITPYNLYRLNNTNETTSDYGVDDMYAFKYKAKRSATSDVVVKIKQELSTGSLLPNVIYRLGGYYKIELSIAGGSALINWYLKDLGETITLIDGINLAPQYSYTTTTWEEFYTTASSNTFSQSQLDTILLLHQICLYNSVNTNDYATVWFDNLYLEHAKGTIDQSSGVFTFTDYPTAGSHKWDEIDYEQVIELADGSEKRFNSSGRRSSRWKFSCNFENVSETFLRQLRILEQWQKAGNKLVFHTNETAEMNHPPVMIGYMDLPGDSEILWDLTKATFSFQFTEAR